MEKLRALSAVKVLIVIVFSSILFRCVSGVNITVGGENGWDLFSNIQAWSSITTFNIGDDLVFTYTALHDVVEVNKEGYNTCTITNALATYDNFNGETVIHLSEAGTRYFVCGRMRHCLEGLKLQVQVLANNGTGDDQDQPSSGDRVGELRGLVLRITLVITSILVITFILIITFTVITMFYAALVYCV